MPVSLPMRSLLALTLLSVASVVDALGQAIVVNKCNFPAYLWSVSNTQGPMITLSPSGGTYSETYQINPAGGGVSIKIGESDSLADPILQFEYTYLNLLWYDLSKVNGSPFENHGLSLIPSSDSCKAVHCHPQTGCGGPGNVFYEPYDNSAVEACDPSANLVFTLCSHGSGSGSSGSGASSPAPAPALAPQPSIASSPAFSVPASSIPASTVPAPAAPAPTVASAPAYNPGGALTTLITEYVTIETTTDQWVTVTAAK